MNSVTAIFSAIAEFFGWRKQRDANLNAADVKTAEKGKDEAKSEAKTADAIAKKDTNEIRNELAE